MFDVQSGGLSRTAIRDDAGSRQHEVAFDAHAAVQLDDAAVVYGIDRNTTDIVHTGVLDEPQELLPGVLSESLLLRNILRCNKSHRYTASRQ